MRRLLSAYLYVVIACVFESKRINRYDLTHTTNTTERSVSNQGIRPYRWNDRLKTKIVSMLVDRVCIQRKRNCRLFMCADLFLYFVFLFYASPSVSVCSHTSASFGETMIKCCRYICISKCSLTRAYAEHHFVCVRFFVKRKSFSLSVFVVIVVCLVKNILNSTH